MNQQERDEMRARHACDGYSNPGCIVCFVDYPCDVVKVLDAWEAQPATIHTKFEVGDKVGYIGHPEWGVYSVKAIDAWCTIVNDDDDVLEDCVPEEELRPMLRCDHITSSDPDEEGKAMGYLYCPKCGEKL